jgi:MFS transporter, ACS family, tartrate transporter
VCAGAFLYYWSRHSDRTGERVGHTSGAMLLAAVGLVASGFLLETSPVLALVAICVGAMGIFAALSPFWELPSSVLAGAAAASGIALINSLGNLGGFASPYAVGVLVDLTGDSKSGLLLLAAVLFITAVATFLYARTIHAGKVPTGSHEDVLAKEVAAFDLASEELHHRGDPDSPPTTPREKTQ